MASGLSIVEIQKQIKENEKRMAAIKALPLYQTLMATGLLVDDYPYNPNTPFFGVRRLRFKHSFKYFVMMKYHNNDPRTRVLFNAEKNLSFQKYDKERLGLGYENISFEEIFNDTPPEIQEQMIWHMDLFR